MKLFQITIRNKLTNRCVQSVEVYAENQRQAFSNVVRFYKQYMDNPHYRVNVKVLRHV